MRPLPGIEWQFLINRAEAARFGADIRTIGHAIQMMTHGLTLAKYRPEDVNEEVEVRARLPSEYRYLDMLQSMSVGTLNGQVPLMNFVTFEPVAAVANINRTNSARVLKIEAYMRSPYLAANELPKVLEQIPKHALADGV